MAKVIKEGFCFRHSIFDMELSLIPVPFANLYWLISPRASRSFSTTLLVMLFACRLFMMSETISSFRNISKYFTGKLQLLGRKFFKFVNGGIKQRIFPQQLVLHKLRFRESACGKSNSAATDNFIIIEKVGFCSKFPIFEIELLLTSAIKDKRYGVIFFSRQ